MRMPNTLQTPSTFERPPRAATAIILTCAIFLLVLLGWAAAAAVQEVTRGNGKVIPSKRMQVVQSSEPGVVTHIEIRLGQRVKKGDLLIKLDKTPNAAKLGEVQAQVRALTVQIARLESEAKATADDIPQFNCPSKIKASAPDLCKNETRMLLVQKQNLQKRLEVHRQRIIQRKRALDETKATLVKLEEAYGLAARERKLVAPMARRKLVSQTELLRVLRQLSETKGQIAIAKQNLAKQAAAITEAELQLDEQVLAFRRDTLTDLTKARSQLSVANETLRGAADRVARTTIRSPIDGIVNALNITTIGAFVAAGDKLLEIVPLEDKLLVEARIRPSDIAFIRAGQKAVVKVTAYDFFVYGGLNGVVERVSADSIYDPNLKESFYTVTVRTGESKLQSKGKTLTILPGMICDVDIITGQKTILQYILKPIRRARWEALRER